jgi:DNA mismatch repair ATPase MutS
MQFSSILFDHIQRAVQLSHSLDFYTDLNLDQIIETTISYKKEFDIKKFFYVPLTDKNSIVYRQEIVKDLQKEKFYLKVDKFSNKLLDIKKQQDMIKNLEYKEYKNGWFLQMVIMYCEALESFYEVLKSADLCSQGFIRFRTYLQDYLQNEDFLSFKKEMMLVKERLDSVVYDVTIDGMIFRVKKYEDEDNYTKEIEKVFSKFEQGDVKPQKCQFDKDRGINHVNAKILEFVSKLYSDIFLQLHKFCQKYENFIDETFLIFANEVEFYISYLEYIEDIKEQGVSFCFPNISEDDKYIQIEEGFDLALAYSLKFDKKRVVPNDYSLKNQERIMVVTGANQGGKSTFARAFGQINYLSKLGLPVPAYSVKLFLIDSIFTHFEKEEDISTLSSKLQEDLIRIHAIFEKATPKSLVILNEIFSSTSLQDAIFLSKKIMNKIDERDLFCVWITFIYKINEMSSKTVSLTSVVNDEDISKRTYKIIKKDSDGLAYAQSVAKKYHLSYEQILQRIES